MSSIAGRLHPDTLLHALLDSVGVALVVIDSQGRFVFTNQAALRMLGSAKSMNGISLEEWRRDYVFRDPQGRPIPTEKAPIIRALAGEPVPPQYMDVTLPDGRRKWLHAAGHYFSVLGLTGVFVIITDETEEIELRRALELAQRTEALGLLIGGLAHDLNNMLFVVSQNLYVAQTDAGVPEAVRARLGQTTAALERASALGKRLVRHNRAQELHICLVQINDLVNVVLELVHPLLKSRVRVHTELGLLPLVEVDPSRVEQVLFNLILNALDAMPEGGDLTLRTEVVENAAMAEIEADVDKGRRSPPFVCITVADTGIGIPEELRASIFDPFFTTKPAGKGSGLGLATAQAIVRQHNGYIKVQSVPGSGSKFSVYLPQRGPSTAP